MKSLMLLNPRRKRRSKRKVSARRRTTRRRRSMRRPNAYVRNAKVRKTSKAAAKASASKPTRRRKKSSSARRAVRRFGRRASKAFRGFGGGSIASQVKGVFSKENLTVAAGGVGATVLTNFILSRTKADGSSLLPMVFGGLINGIVEAIKGYAPVETKKALGFAEYLEYTPMSALNGTPGYSAINQFSNVRPMNSAFANSSAFPADAWGR